MFIQHRFISTFITVCFFCHKRINSKTNIVNIVNVLHLCVISSSIRFQKAKCMQICSGNVVAAGFTLIIFEHCKYNHVCNYAFFIALFDKHFYKLYVTVIWNYSTIMQH